MVLLTCTCKNVRPIMENVLGIDGWMMFESVPNIDDMTIEIYKANSPKIKECRKSLEKEFKVMRVEANMEKDCIEIVISQRNPENQSELKDLLLQSREKKLKELENALNEYLKAYTEMNEKLMEVKLVRKEINLLNKQILNGEV